MLVRIVFLVPSFRDLRCLRARVAFGVVTNIYYRVVLLEQQLRTTKTDRWHRAGYGSHFGQLAPRSCKVQNPGSVWDPGAAPANASAEKEEDFLFRH